MKLLLIISLLFLAGRYYFQLPAYKTKIVLEDSPTVVEANMKTMRALCQKLDRRGVTNFFVTATADSTLIVNNERFGPFAQVTADQLKGSSIFNNLSTKEIDHLLKVYGTLNRNLVYAVFYDIGRKSWVFEYGYDVRYNEFEHQRALFLANDGPPFDPAYTLDIVYHQAGTWVNRPAGQSWAAAADKVGYSQVQDWQQHPADKLVSLATLTKEGREVSVRATSLTPMQLMTDGLRKTRNRSERAGDGFPAKNESDRRCLVHRSGQQRTGGFAGARQPRAGRGSSRITGGKSYRAAPDRRDLANLGQSRSAYAARWVIGYEEAANR